jgi:hypothetical protein
MLDPFANHFRFLPTEQLEKKTPWADKNAAATGIVTGNRKVFQRPSRKLPNTPICQVSAYIQAARWDVNKGKNPTKRDVL